MDRFLFNLALISLRSCCISSSLQLRKSILSSISRPVSSTSSYALYLVIFAGIRDLSIRQEELGDFVARV